MKKNKLLFLSAVVVLAVFAIILSYQFKAQKKPITPGNVNENYVEYIASSPDGGGMENVLQQQSQPSNPDLSPSYQEYLKTTKAAPAPKSVEFIATGPDGAGLTVLPKKSSKGPSGKIPSVVEYINEFPAEF